MLGDLDKQKLLQSLMSTSLFVFVVIDLIIVMVICDVNMDSYEQQVYNYNLLYTDVQI
jgi:hypothetical protein